MRNLLRQLNEIGSIKEGKGNAIPEPQRSMNTDTCNKCTTLLNCLVNFMAPQEPQVLMFPHERGQFSRSSAFRIPLTFLHRKFRYYGEENIDVGAGISRKLIKHDNDTLRIILQRKSGVCFIFSKIQEDQ
ncbi:hypothetical protein TNCV_779141 [Trichonephila clavipes]|nr:hypothetical protein TNCV_779141 [Trichonephila clavipes]